MKVVAIIQSRMRSTRLPGKALAPIEGRPMAAHVIERALAIKLVDQVILNVPHHDDAAFNAGLIDIDLARDGHWDIVAIKDQERDVLGSYREIAVASGADVIMRLTGDCPLLDPELCDRVLNMFLGMQNPYAYCANDTLRSGYPDGTDCEVFSALALNVAYENAAQGHEREHVTTWIRRHLDNYSIMTKLTEFYRYYGEKVKFSVDIKDDLARACAVMKRLQPGSFSIRHTWDAFLRAQQEDSV